jgi:hypothetical protein
VKTEEDEAFEELERAQGWRKRQIADAASKPTQAEEEMYKMGWNSALEMAAVRIMNDFKLAFPDDTVSSFAIYVRGMKK